jgi:hypothetical protein
MYAFLFAFPLDLVTVVGPLGSAATACAPRCGFPPF